MKTTILTTFTLLLLLSSCEVTTTHTTTFKIDPLTNTTTIPLNQLKPLPQTTINNTETTICSWNLQIYGQKKASNDTLLENYRQILEDKLNCDLIFIQEIRDTSPDSFNKLCSLFNWTATKCFTSQRSGTTNSKEQYGVILNPTRIELLQIDDKMNQSNQLLWERPPLGIAIQTIHNQTIILYTMHLKPSDVYRELDNTYEAIKDQDYPTILLGDGNLDCDYYDETNKTRFKDWDWWIPDEADTTVSQTKCSFDRIIANHQTRPLVHSVGLLNLDITSSMSDHYPIWIKIK